MIIVKGIVGTLISTCAQLLKKYILWDKHCIDLPYGSTPKHEKILQEECNSYSSLLLEKCNVGQMLTLFPYYAHGLSELHDC